MWLLILCFIIKNILLIVKLPMTNFQIKRQKFSRFCYIIFILLIFDNLFYSISKLFRQVYFRSIENLRMISSSVINIRILLFLLVKAGEPFKINTFFYLLWFECMNYHVAGRLLYRIRVITINYFIQTFPSRISVQELWLQISSIFLSLILNHIFNPDINFIKLLILFYILHAISS